MNTSEQPPPADSHEALRRAAYNAYAVLKVQRAIAFTTALDPTIAELEEALGMTKKKETAQNVDRRKMNRNENLPPGVRLDDIDSDVCPGCEGHGEIETAKRGAYDSSNCRGAFETKWITCPDCGGLGVLNERTK